MTRLALVLAWMGSLAVVAQAEGVQNLPVVGRTAAQCLAFSRRYRAYLSVEAGDGDTPVFIVQSGNDFAEGLQWIMHRAAIASRMQVMVWSSHFQLECEVAA